MTRRWPAVVAVGLSACLAPPRGDVGSDVRAPTAAWNAFRGCVVARDWDRAWGLVSARARRAEFRDDPAVFRAFADGSGAPLLAEVAASREVRIDATGGRAYSDLAGPLVVGVGLVREGTVWRVDDLVRPEEAMP